MHKGGRVSASENRLICKQKLILFTQLNLIPLQLKFNSNSKPNQQDPSIVLPFYEHKIDLILLSNYFETS